MLQFSGHFALALVPYRLKQLWITISLCHVNCAVLIFVLQSMLTISQDAEEPDEELGNNEDDERDFEQEFD